MNIPFIDLKPQYQALKTDIDERIQAVLNHGRFILGPEVEEAEKALSEFTKAKHSITCSNGSDALLMALLALDIGPGDEVITTSFSFIATAEMIELAGATPVMVDIDPKTFNLMPSEIEKALTPKTKAIMPVSLYGQMADMDAIQKIADKHNIPVIEDAAQSFGASFNGQRSCSMGTLGCTSFFPAKPLGAFGDGGAVFTNDDQLAEKLISIRMHGMGEQRYEHVRLGINGRMDSIQCAVITAKLSRYPWEVEQRNRIASHYTEAFTPLKEQGLIPPFVDERCQSVWAQFTVQVPDRAKFQAALKDKGVPTAVHYPLTMTAQPAYKKWAKLATPNAQYASEHVVSLPMYPDMPDKDLEYIVQTIKEVFQ